MAAYKDLSRDELLEMKRTEIRYVQRETIRSAA